MRARACCRAGLEASRPKDEIDEVDEVEESFEAFEEEAPEVETTKQYFEPRRRRIRHRGLRGHGEGEAAPEAETGAVWGADMEPEQELRPGAERGGETAGSLQHARCVDVGLCRR